MKIKAIAGLCRKSKMAALLQEPDENGVVTRQYIGDGNAAYPVFGLPVLDRESLLTIFDIPEKQRQEWYVSCSAPPENLNLSDTDPYEQVIEPEGIMFVQSGKVLKPLRTKTGIIFIDNRYLAPLGDVLDVVELYERVTPEGRSYIVAKAGFMLQAVIMPYDMIHENFVQQLEGLAFQCRKALSAVPEKPGKAWKGAGSQ